MNPAQTIGCCAAIVMAGIVLWPVLRHGFVELRKQGIFFCLIAAGFLWSMATKPPQPQITWDSGLRNNGSEFDTNTWAAITFKWTKDAYIPGTDPLFFAMKARDAGSDIMPVDIGETTAGALSWSYAFTGGENATNYLYYAYLGGSVHTNGVWLGNILIKQHPGDGDVDKMVIIRGKLNVNGNVIAPVKENP